MERRTRAEGSPRPEVELFLAALESFHVGQVL